MKSKTIFNCLFIFLLTVSIRIIPSTLELLTADACVYLDIARNISAGKGFYVSYNLYNLWTGITFPSLIYSHPVFPILLAIVLKISGTVFAAIFSNVILAGLNAIILYFVLENIYQNHRISFYGAILSSFSFSSFLTSIYIWTEQLHLLILLLAIFLLLNNWKNVRRIHLLFLGVIIAIGCLTRVAGLFNLFAFVIFIFLEKGFKKETLTLAGCVLLGFLAVIIPYQLLCFFRYNMFYPQYTRLQWDRALFLGGYFDTQSIPVLKSINMSGSLGVSLIVSLMWDKILLSLRVIYQNFGILFFFLFVKRKLDGVTDKIWKQDLLLIIATINFIVILIYPTWVVELDVVRYNLITCFLLIPVALVSLLDIFDSLGKKFNANFCYYMAITLINLSLLTQMFPYLSYFSKDSNNIEREHQSLRREVFSWIKKNSFSQQRIGLCFTLIQEGFELDRPVVSIPEGKLLTSCNVKNFLAIYKPSFMIISKEKLSKYMNILRPFAKEIETKASWSKEYIVYKPNINTEGR